MSLGEELNRLRNLNGVSLREVENATGVSNAYLSQLERSKASNPSPKVLAKLADYYQVRCESLLAAAGYLNQNAISIGSKGEMVFSDGGLPSEETPGVLKQALFEADLDEEEQKLVADYISFLRSRKK